jgi:hypothetical protein
MENPIPQEDQAATFLHVGTGQAAKDLGLCKDQAASANHHLSGRKCALRQDSING